jgi:hypothetical protein
VDNEGLAVAGVHAYRFLDAKNKVLNGDVKVTVLDKNFLSTAEYKKNAAKFNSPAYVSGKGVVNGKNTRIYHLSIS